MNVPFISPQDEQARYAASLCVNDLVPIRTHLRLLSYNIQAGIASTRAHHYVTQGWKNVLPHTRSFENLDRIAHVVSDYDVVALQEADAGSMRSYFINQIDVHNPSFPLRYVAARSRYRVVCRSVRAKSVAVLTHLRFKYFAQYLIDRLLQQAVLYRRDAEQAASTTCFGYLYCSHCCWLVVSGHYLFPDTRPVPFQMGLRIVDRFTIHPGNTIIALDRSPCSFQILLREYDFQFHFFHLAH